MQTRSVRLVILTLLLATPLAAASLLWTIDRRAAADVAAGEALASHVDRIRDGLAAIGAAQQGYVAPGQLDEPLFERTTALLEALRGALAAVRPLLHSTDAAAALDALIESADALQAADARTRQNLSLGQDLMAADVIFSDGRNILDGMVARLRELQAAERAAAGAQLVARSTTRWGVFALLAIGWMAAWLAVASHVPRVPGVPDVPKVHDDLRTSTSGTLSTPGTSTSGIPGTLPVDLAAAAALCTDLSRIADSSALPALFARATSLLDASGVTLWMSAGEQLFAVLGHGYPPEHLARFGPIARTADNAAAAAWRTGRASVIAGDATTPGALVVPMFGPEGCRGVLALEIRHGGEQEPAVQGVAAMIAAQLATAVAAWPAASEAPAEAPEARSA